MINPTDTCAAQSWNANLAINGEKGGSVFSGGGGLDYKGVWMAKVHAEEREYSLL